MSELSISRVLIDVADPHRDSFEKLGIKLPRHLSTYRRRWASLLVIAVTGSFASGPIASWPTLEPLLISAGVWAGPDQQKNLTKVFAITTAISMLTTVFSGIWYDASGPRALGAYGAFGAAIFLFIMAVAIIVPSLNWMLWFAYPTAVFFGSVNTSDVFAWLWLLPEDQNLVASIAQAVQALSDSFVLIAVVLHDSLGISIQGYFIISGVLSFVAGYLALVLIPEQTELMHMSHVVTRQSRADFSDLNYGATDDVESRAAASEHHSSTGVWPVMLKTWTLLKDLRILVFKLHPTICLLFLLYTTSAYLYTIFPEIDMFPFYEDLVGTRKAIKLVNIFGGLYAICSAVFSLMYGKLIDTFGLVNAVAVTIVPFLVTMYLYTIPTVSAQTLAQVLLSFYSSTYFILWPRFACLYGPPELFGIIYGFAVAVMGIGQLIVPNTITWGCKFFGHMLESGRAVKAVPYLLNFAFCCLLSVFFSILLLLWWCIHPVPNVGSTTLEKLHVIEKGSIGAVDQAASKLSYDEIVAQPSSAALSLLSARSEMRHATTGCGCGWFRCSCGWFPERRVGRSGTSGVSFP